MRMMSFLPLGASREEYIPPYTGAINPSPDLARVVETDLFNHDQEEPPARRYPERQRRAPPDME